MIVADLLLAAGAFFAAYLLRDHVESLNPLVEYTWILPIFVLLWGALLYSSGMYSSFRLKSIVDIMMIIAKAAFFGIGTFGAINYLFRLQHVSRGFIFLSFGLATVLIMAEKAAIVTFFRYLRREGFNFKNVLIAGTGPRAQRFIRQIDDTKEFGLKIFGVVDEEISKVGEEVCGHKVIGTLHDIPRILKESPLDHVIFIMPRSLLSKLEEPILYCETVGVTVSVAVDLFNLRITTGKESSLLGVPILTFESTPDKVGSLLFKRVMDLCLSAAGLFVLSPLLLGAAIVIRLTSDGPVLFRQKRVGVNGRIFKLYKFRTMVKDAEEKLAELREQNEMQGPVFKMTDDPRLTAIGRFLRKTSIDELPQLFNVLKGDMSLVGPRPPISTEVTQYDHWQRRRLSMRPGITCFWQISGRNKIVNFDQWMKMDLEYIDNWSLSLDAMILLKTIPVVLFGVGAK